MIDIRYRRQPVDLTGITRIIATSANGIAALVANADPRGLHAHCVGEATALAAQDAGMTADFADGTGTGLIARLRADPPQGPLLYVRGAEMRVDVAAALQRDGMDVRACVLYDQIPVALNHRAREVLTAEGPVLLPLYSPNSARRLGDQAQTATAPLHLVALSTAVAESWTGTTPHSLKISPDPDAKPMLRTICESYARLFA